MYMVANCHEPLMSFSDHWSRGQPFVSQLFLWQTSFNAVMPYHRSRARSLLLDLLLFFLDGQTVLISKNLRQINNHY